MYLTKTEITRISAYLVNTEVRDRVWGKVKYCLGLNDLNLSERDFLLYSTMLDRKITDSSTEEDVLLVKIAPCLIQHLTEQDNTKPWNKWYENPELAFDVLSKKYPPLAPIEPYGDDPENLSTIQAIVPFKTRYGILNQLINTNHGHDFICDELISSPLTKALEERGSVTGVLELFYRVLSYGKSDKGVFIRTPKTPHDMNNTELLSWHGMSVTDVSGDDEIFFRYITAGFKYLLPENNRYPNKRFESMFTSTYKDTRGSVVQRRYAHEIASPELPLYFTIHQLNDVGYTVASIGNVYFEVEGINLP